MNFLDLAKTRYTAKTYSTDNKISDEKINQLKEIIRLSPSSINSQPWKFTFVTDEKMKEKFAASSYWNGQKINEASNLVIFSVLDNIDIFEKQINEHLNEGSINYYNEFVKVKGENEIKAWLKHQVYLSLGFFLSACAELGIDSTPMEGIKNNEYDDILQLENYKTLFAVAIGYRNPEDANQPSLTPKSRLQITEVVQTL